uniref:Venom protein n=1 Tax=Ampulex compressa TaxID=860918 RepID=A0A1W6EWA7_AMPCP|nr:venom protein [Ampulex compressa]
MKPILIRCICIVLLCAVSNASDSYLDYRLKLHLRYVQDLQEDILQKINNLYPQSIVTEFGTKFSWSVAKHFLFDGLDTKISEALKETLVSTVSSCHNVQ